MGCDAPPDPGRDRPHRLLPGRGRRPADQPDPLPSLLPREAGFLPRERRHLRVSGQQRPQFPDGVGPPELQAVPLAPDRTVCRSHPGTHRGRCQTHRPRGRLRHRPAEHADPKRLPLSGRELHRREAAEERSGEQRRRPDVRRPRRHRVGGQRRLQPVLRRRQQPSHPGRTDARELVLRPHG